MSSNLIWRRKWDARIQQLALRSLSPGKKTVVSFTTKYGVPRQIKPRILESSIRRSQSNLSVVLTFLLSEERDCHRVVVVPKRQIGFDCRWYCGHNHRRRQANHFFVSFFSIELGGIAKHLMTSPSGNRGFCFPLSWGNKTLCFPSGASH